MSRHFLLNHSAKLCDKLTFTFNMTLEDYLPENNVHSDASTSSEMEEEHDTCDSGVSASAWGGVLAGALRRAARQGRLTCGVTAAAQVLERGTASVRLCVLAPPSSRGGGGLLHLHSVLLEAHCYENGIPTIKVDSAEKLAAIVGPSCECVLVLGGGKGGHRPRHNKGKGGKNASTLGESGLLAAAQAGVQPSVLVLPVSPPP